MKELKRRVVLSSGGTGGHVFPSQALAKELTSQGIDVFLFTDERGKRHAEKQIRDDSRRDDRGRVAVTPEIIKIPAGHLRGGIKEKLKGAFKLVKGVGTALYHLRRLRPDVVVGFGGYASFPTVLAATLLRLPIIIHQADAYFGRTNRLLSPFVTCIATSFSDVENIPRACQKKVSFTGLPIRDEIQASPYISSEADAPFYLLVTGGSQGARIFGDILPQAVNLLKPSLQRRLYISQQCREESLKTTASLYAKTQAHVELSPFLDQMGERYKKAHLVISRAGASSVVEAALAGRPAIFVPYPYAMDDHQFYNAQQAMRRGGGWIMREKDFTFNTLSNFLSDVLTSPWKLKDASVNIRGISIPDAPSRLAHLVNQLISQKE